MKESKRKSSIFPLVTVNFPLLFQSKYSLPPPTRPPVHQKTNIKRLIPRAKLGLFFQADEVGRCLRQGKTQSEIMPLEESVLIMDVMDEVRKQGEVKYPEVVESF